jgi:hypothetical protein
MAAKLLLSLSADQATAAIWRRRKLSSIRQFANDDSGWSEFGSYLRAAKGAPVSIIVDTIDEDYRFETLPRAGGGDRAQMVARKIRQLYRSTPYAAAALQERSTGRRGYDRYLFAALTSPEILAPWLRILQQSRAPIAGVHLLPMATLALIDRLKLKQPNVLLVAKSGAGLRQTFCKQSRFRISRLTPLRGLTTPADQFYAEEIGNTRMYLDALTVTHVDDAVSVVILDQDGSLAGLPAAIASGRPNLKPEILGPADIESRLGIPATELRQSADVLHLWLLATSSRLIDLAPPVVESGFRVYRVRQLMYAAVGACTIASLAWAGMDLFRAQRASAQTQALTEQARKFEAMYREVTAQFPKAPATAREMREAVEVAENLRSQLRTPQAMFAVIGGALERSPNILLSRVEWRISPPGTTATVVQGRGATAPPPGAGQGLQQTGIVTAEVTDYDGNYRTAVARIQDFVRRLAANDQVAEVNVLELPVNISSSTGLTGDTSASASAKGAVFRVAVSFAPGA